MKSQGNEGAHGGRKTTPEGPRGGRAGQAAEGSRGGRAGQGVEGSRSTKDPMRDVALGEGLEMGAVHSAHKKGIVNGLGGKQAASPAPSGESDHETLRHGKKPQPEKVVNVAKHDKETLAKARMFAERSEAGNAEKEGGW